MADAGHYNYFRDYDPSIGRYIESDPIGLDGGMNTFGYVQGNPLGLIDPTGEAAASIARACARYPTICGSLLYCYASPTKCKELLCKASSAISRYKPLCNQPGCGPAGAPNTNTMAMTMACTCFVNRVFEKYVCRGGKSDKGHDEQIDGAREKCEDCLRKCMT